MVKISVLTPTIRKEQGGLDRPRQSMINQNFRDFEWLIEDHDPKQPPDFNAAMNRMLKRAKGELIVFLQDFIKISPDGLLKFWHAYERDPNTFFTAPVGKIFRGEAVDWDWRKYRGFEEINFMEWEIDWAAAPRSALFQIGGFDEVLDKYWGFDNVNVGLRAAEAGFKMKNLPNNPAIAFDHNQQFNHPYMMLRNADFHNERLQDITQGLKINFL